MAADTRWSREADRVAATKPAREGQWKRFLDEVDPDRQLPEAERQRRAESAQRAHMTRMSLAAARARRRRREKKAGGK